MAAGIQPAQWPPQPVGPPVPAEGGGRRRRRRLEEGGGGSTSSTTRTEGSPELSSWLTDWKALYSQRLHGEGQPLTADTERMKDRAISDISDTSEGRQVAISEDLARRGIGGDSGVAAALSGEEREASKRLQAKAASDIEIAQQARADDMKLARERGTDALLGIGAAGAGALANLHLGQSDVLLRQSALAADQRARELQTAMDAMRISSAYAPPPSYVPPAMPTTARPSYLGRNTSGRGARLI